MSNPAPHARHLAPIARAIREEILQANGLQIDKTPIDCLDPGYGSARESHLWVYGDIVSGIRYLDWHAGREAKCPEDQRHLPGSNVAKALKYTLNQRHKILATR